MFNKFRNDIVKTELPFTIPDNLSSNILGEYYFEFEEKPKNLNRLISKIDKNGIPINKTYVDVTDKEFVYFPISIGQMGLAVFHTYLKTKTESDRERFLKFPEWFFTNADRDSKLGARWLTNVNLPQYKTPAPWQSAFSQSRGISLLLRGYQLTENIQFAEMAEEALKAFLIPVKEGGVVSETQWGPFYEEYISTEPTLVLNGKIFALCGIQDFKRVFPENETAKKIFNDGIETLKNVLPEYDLGYWSRYNFCTAEWHPDIDPATIGYQLLHVVQLRMLYQLTGENIFNEYAEKFMSQKTFANVLKMYRVKYRSLKKIGRL